MLLKPAVPFNPVIVKDTMVVLVGWYDVIVALDICELVTFPLIARSTVAPLPVVAVTFVADGVEVGDGVGVGVGVGLGVGIGVGLEVDVGVGVGAIVTVNELLVPVLLPSVAVILTPGPAVVTVTEVDPTPLMKVFIVIGLIDPAEYVKDGVPV